MSGRWEADIDAPPESVRSVFFDWPKFPEWADGLVRGIERKPGESGPLRVGEIVTAHLSGSVTTDVTVTDVSDTRICWTGDAYLVLSGDMTFEIQPHESNPQKSKFVMLEDYRRLTWILAKVPIISDFMSAEYLRFPMSLKARVESLDKQLAMKNSRL